MEQRTVSEDFARLQAKARAARIPVYIHLAILAAALVALIAMRQFLVPLLLVAAGTLFYIFVVRAANRKFSEAMVEANLRHGLCEGMEDYAYQPKGGMEQDRFVRWAILPVMEKGGKGVMCRSSFTGRRGATRIFGSEITVHYETGAAQVRRKYEFLVGTLLTAEADAVAGKGDWLLLREELVSDHALAEFLNSNGYRPADAMLMGWDIYTRTEEDRLPDELAGKILDFSDAAKDSGALRLAPEGAAVYLHRKFIAGRLTGPLTEHAISMNTLPERDDVWRLFDFWIKGAAE